MDTYRPRTKFISACMWSNDRRASEEATGCDRVVVEMMPICICNIEFVARPEKRRHLGMCLQESEGALRHSKPPVVDEVILKEEEGP